MIYTAKYGERSNLEIVAEAMDVSFDEHTDTMQLAKKLAQKVTDLMRELNIKSIKDPATRWKTVWNQRSALCMTELLEIHRESQDGGNKRIYQRYYSMY